MSWRFLCVERILHLLNFSVLLQDFQYTLAFNSTTVHALPMVVNILSNAVLRGLNGTGRIRTWTKPFDFVRRLKVRL